MQSIIFGCNENFRDDIPSRKKNFLLRMKPKIFRKPSVQFFFSTKKSETVDIFWHHFKSDFFVELLKGFNSRLVHFCCHCHCCFCIQCCCCFFTYTDFFVWLCKACLRNNVVNSTKVKWCARVTCGAHLSLSFSLSLSLSFSLTANTFAGICA